MYFRMRNLAFRKEAALEYFWRKEMFEKIALNAAEMLVMLFWVVILFILVYGALWMRALKRTQPSSAEKS